MPFVALALLLLIPLALVALMPVLQIQRFRVGTSRRLARPWLATVNVIAMLFSACVFLATAALTNVWIAGALGSAASGMLVGCVLGIIGLAMSRWEPTPRTLHYTPNRWLVLLITLAVAARVIYGFWRGWTVLRSGVTDQSWVSAVGVPGSLFAGAVVIGYYLAYGIGLRRRISKWQKRPLRVM